MAFSKKTGLNKWLVEHLVIFISILRWIVLSVITGALVGISSSLFIKILELSLVFQKHIPYYFLTLPLGLFISLLLVQKFAKEAEGHGTEKVIEAIHQKNGKIKPAVVPIKLLSTVVTIITGGSVGKEGPSAQIGAGIASIFADILKFSDKDRRKLVICGISGGFASVFGAPLAGAIFGMEVLFIGSMVYDVLLASFISGFISYKTSLLIGMSYTYHPIEILQSFSFSMFLKIILIGIFAGIIASIFIEILRLTEYIASNISWDKKLKPIIGGVVLILLTFLFKTQYLSLGMEEINNALKGSHVPLLSPLLKTIFTTITLSFGGSGGIVTPIFFVGSTFGNLISPLFHISPKIGAALGMMAVLSGATNTPIASTVMAIELFGPQIAPLAAIANVISFFMTGHRSVYPSQVLAMNKSDILHIETGIIIEEAKDFKIKWNRSCIFVRLYLNILRRFKKKKTYS